MRYVPTAVPVGRSGCDGGGGLTVARTPVASCWDSRNSTDSRRLASPAERSATNALRSLNGRSSAAL